MPHIPVAVRALSEVYADLGADHRLLVIEAAKYLADLKGQCRALLGQLRTEHRPANRSAILYALAWQGDPRAWWPFLKVAANLEEAPEVRGQAIEGVAYLFSTKRPGSLSVLVATEVIRSAAYDPDSRVRWDAAFALGATRDPSVIPDLERMRAEADLATPAGLAVARKAREAIELIRWPER